MRTKIAKTTSERRVALSIESSRREMDYDGPTDDEFARSVPVGRGPQAIFAKPKSKAADITRKSLVVRVENDIAKVFKTEKQVNNALRKLIQDQQTAKSSKRKSA
jgi:hypothetical protein